MPHRLFVGIRPPGDIRDALIDLMEGIDLARWQDDDQLHLTLRYVGEVDTHLAEDLAGRLREVDMPPFDLTIAGTGTFAKKGRPHTLWAGIEPSDGLRRLQRRIERICISAGLEPEHRKYHPHITLARINRSTGALAPFFAATASLRLGPWRAESYILFESTLGRHGSVYDPIVRYPIETGP
ncbi:RNA 2',3'-cyclic phosphodiesterase [Qipengyuania qiaonensis]|uniref:RNA 2',3'-cyclic phosphodiesterase n=1 Tax=Qipengyuania qiaonensis TaxID=2867240 RepID=A0ABS7J5U6_9SPHN|nr:RNA 2',3'-cyclic phosphodiesterase [Qipengyuania qiaonensis]MBX7482709.1 RNA 2',3'-cyclic phosphodiesterase [Qipengyuania qiaonensis]